MSQPDGTIDDVLDLLYLAAVDPPQWPAFLAALARLFDAHAADLIAQQCGDARFSVGAAVGISRELIRQYEEYYVAVDPWHRELARRGLPPVVCRGSELCPPAQFENTEFYADFWKTSAAFYQAGMFNKSPEQSAMVSLHRARARKDFEDAEILLLQRFSPHVRRALAIHRKSIDLSISLAQMAGAVDALDSGVISLGRRRRIRFMNASAAALVEAGDLLEERNGCLALRDPKADEALDCLLGATGTRSLQTPAGGSLQVSTAERRLLLTVLPANSHSVIGGPVTALLLIVDPKTRPKSRSELMRQLWNLTPAETRVVMLLLEGLDPNGIAARTNTTAGTVRFQLKAIYQKTGVSRQSRLIRLISRLPGS